MFVDGGLFCVLKGQKQTYKKLKRKKSKQHETGWQDCGLKPQRCLSEITAVNPVTFSPVPPNVLC